MYVQISSCPASAYLNEKTSNKRGEERKEARRKQIHKSVSSFPRLNKQIHRLFRERKGTTVGRFLVHGDTRKEEGSAKRARPMT